MLCYQDVYVVKISGDFDKFVEVSEWKKFGILKKRPACSKHFSKTYEDFVTNTSSVFAFIKFPFIIGILSLVTKFHV